MVHAEPGFLESYLDGEVSNCSGLSILNDEEMGIFLTGITDTVFLSEVRDNFCVDLGIENNEVTKNFAVVCDKLLKALDHHSFFSSVQSRFQHDRSYILCLLATLYTYIHRHQGVCHPPREDCPRQHRQHCPRPPVLPYCVQPTGSRPP